MNTHMNNKKIVVAAAGLAITLTSGASFAAINSDGSVSSSSANAVSTMRINIDYRANSIIDGVHGDQLSGVISRDVSGAANVDELTGSSVFLKNTNDKNGLTFSLSSIVPSNAKLIRVMTGKYTCSSVSVDHSLANALPIKKPDGSSEIRIDVTDTTAPHTVEASGCKGFDNSGGSSAVSIAYSLTGDNTGGFGAKPSFITDGMSVPARDSVVEKPQAVNLSDFVLGKALENQFPSQDKEGGELLFDTDSQAILGRLVDVAGFNKIGITDDFGSVCSSCHSYVMSYTFGVIVRAPGPVSVAATAGFGSQMMVMIKNQSGGWSPISKLNGYTVNGVFNAPLAGVYPVRVGVAVSRSANLSKFAVATKTATDVEYQSLSASNEAYRVPKDSLSSAPVAAPASGSTVPVPVAAPAIPAPAK